MMYDDLFCEFINEVSKELEKKLEHRNDDYDDCDWDCESCAFYDECSETDDDKVSNDDDIECDGDCENCEFNPDNILNDNAEDDNDDDKDFNDINHPYHYASHGVETIDKIEAVVAGLPARAAVLLGNVIKYVDRAGYKDDAHKDLAKANAYAHRLVYGCWPK